MAKRPYTKKRPDLATLEDMYEVRVKGEYYGTIKVAAESNRKQCEERVHKVIKSIAKRKWVMGVDYELVFIRRIEPVYLLNKKETRGRKKQNVSLDDEDEDDD